MRRADAYVLAVMTAALLVVIHNPRRATAAVWAAAGLVALPLVVRAVGDWLGGGKR